MERVGMVLLWFIFLLHPLRISYANSEGDALLAFKDKLTDPNNVLNSWDPTLVSPCTWFHITCNGDELVTRIDLANSGLSGTLVPQLGQLKNLQYLELYDNSISGTIPNELGDLTNLLSLDLYINNLSGPIPSRLGQLSQLRYLRLNSNNKLTGSIPVSLTNIQSLLVVDLTNNDLSGVVPVNGSFSKFTPASFFGNPHLCYPGVGQC